MRWLMVALVVAGCGSSQSAPSDPGGTGGAEATGGEMGSGGAAASSGGAPGSGGAIVGTGGTGGQAGTGGAPPKPISTLWAVQIQATTWTCTGQMAMTVTDGDGVGTWNCAETAYGCTYRQIYVAQGPCISWTGAARAGFFVDKSVTMQLQTDATHAITVAGTLGTDRVIGTAMFADGNFPFTAVLR